MASIAPASVAAANDAAPSARAGVYRWYVVGVLSLAYAFSAIDARVLTLLVEPIKADLKLSDFQVSLLQGFAFALLYSLAAMPIGRFVDGTRRRTPLIVAGVLFWSAMTMACGFARSFGMLFLTRVGCGVGEATLSPTAYSIIADYFEKQRRALAISFYAIGYPIGGGLALIIGGALLEHFGRDGSLGLGFLGGLAPWQLVFVAVGLPGVIVAALIATIREPARRETAGLGDAGAIPVREVVRYVRDRWRLYLMLIGVTSLSGLLAIGTSLWYPTFLGRTYHLTPGQIGLYYGSLMLVCGTVGTLSGGWLSGFLIRRGRADGNLRIVLGTTAIKAAPLIVGPLMPSAGLALGCMAVATLVGQAAQGVILSAIQDVTPNRLRGQVTALTLLFVNLIGLGLGATTIAAITDFGFRDEGALRYAIAITGAVVLPVMFVMLATGMGRYRRALAEMERAQ
ncbi:MFS transporter [Sphingomonas sp. MMSM20]|uniref:MFS transporter n=1 Tax=Sphingomonas lycopersici TaxID=2951807 RepID=UPI0022384138|nr:MFS transporter [Sphingomonas lycopersici]MCW6532587.1 MFS transporter [Sphingomonas lycopersici]